MNLFIYESMMKSKYKELHWIIENLDLEKGVEIHRTIDSLSQRLCQPMEEPTIAVLLADRKKDLIEILSIKELLNGIKIILVLPDREEDTIAKGGEVCLSACHMQFRQLHA